MPKKEKIADVSAKDKKVTKSGSTELTEDQLDEVSGGPHYTTFDGGSQIQGGSQTQKVQKVRGTFKWR